MIDRNRLDKAGKFQMNYESRRMIQDHTLDNNMRLQQVRYDNGVSVIVHSWGVESWFKLVIVPTHVAITCFRANLKYGFTGPLAGCPDLLLAPERYGAPGSAFTRMPYCKRHFRKGRRFLVFAQSGGLDV